MKVKLNTGTWHKFLNIYIILLVRNLCQFPVNLNNIAWNNCKIFCKKLLISYLYQLELNTYKNCFYHKRHISHIQYFTKRSCDGYENFNSILRLKITTPIKAPELSNNDRLVKMISFFFKLNKKKTLLIKLQCIYIAKRNFLHIY